MPEIKVSVLGTDALDKSSIPAVSNASSSLNLDNQSFTNVTLNSVSDDKNDEMKKAFLSNATLDNINLAQGASGCAITTTQNDLVYKPSYTGDWWQEQWPNKTYYVQSYPYSYTYYYSYQARVAYDKKFVEMKFLIPEFKKDEVSVTLHNDSVKLVCKRKAPLKKKWEYVQGWDENEFTQTVPLPVKVAKKGIKSKLLNGVLTITFKREEPEIKIF